MPSNRLVTLNFISQSGSNSRSVAIEKVIIGGWTGRDKEAMEAHIVELEELGIPRPTTTPLYFRVSAAHISVEDEIQTLGTDSSGEVEFVILQTNNSLWVGVGSDHTDRQVEAYSISVAKQLCNKPIGSDFWPYNEVKDHWDRLIVSSYIVCDGVREQYQRSTLAAMLPADELIKGYVAEQGGLTEGTIMFGGTCAAIGGIRPADRFEYSIEDPILNRSIRSAYNMSSLPSQG